MARRAAASRSHDGRVQREELEERRRPSLYGDEAAGFGHAAELAHRAGELRLGQVLGDVGGPHAVKCCVGEGQVEHAADAQVHGGRAAPLLDEALDLGDVLRRQIERGDPARGPDEFAYERDITARAAARVEHRPARLDAHEAKRFLVFGPGRLEVDVQPRCGAAGNDRQPERDETTESGGPRGYDAGKKVKGRKRQVMVDTDGRGLILEPQPANVQDRDGAPLILRLSRRSFPFIAKVFADMGLAGDRPANATSLIIAIVRKPADEVGFAVHRFFAWISRNRRLWKDPRSDARIG